jgi:hypothetical protein
MKGVELDLSKRRRFGLCLGMAIALYVAAVMAFIVAY